MIYANTKLFAVDPVSKALTVDISELPNDVFVRIYPDACDVGIRVLSDKTGKVSEWVQSNEQRDNENELMFYEFVPTPKSLREFPKLAGWKIITFND